MSVSEEDGRREEDPFWEIALNFDGDVDHRLGNSGFGDSDSNSDPEEDYVGGGKAKTYHLPKTSISLQLAPLASDDGVWSPVGDHAWYSSALLTCLILQGTTMTNITKTAEENKRVSLDSGIVLNHCGAEKELRILELGSGAIGLPGVAFAALLSRQTERFPSWTVTLTDNDKSLLRQLQANVRTNMDSKQIMLDGSKSSCINVEFLDWDVKPRNSETNDQGGNRHDRLLSGDIVIGSELCYTKETADALVKVLLALLERNPAVKIYIVQVTDRYGWKEIVIPELESRQTVKIETIPLTYEIHEAASTMIPMGGALDRYAFGAFCISNVLSR